MVINVDRDVVCEGVGCKRLSYIINVPLHLLQVANDLYSHHFDRRSARRIGSAVPTSGGLLLDLQISISKDEELTQLDHRL